MYFFMSATVFLKYFLGFLLFQEILSTVCWSEFCRFQYRRNLQNAHQHTVVYFIYFFNLIQIYCLKKLSPFPSVHSYVKTYFPRQAVQVTDRKIPSDHWRIEKSRHGDFTWQQVKLEDSGSNNTLLLLSWIWSEYYKITN